MFTQNVAIYAPRTLFLRKIANIVAVTTPNYTYKPVELFQAKAGLSKGE
jgi:hypothetical protein